MLPYILAILFLQHISNLFEITLTPELISYQGVKWMTMLRRVVGYEEEFTLALDAILDERLLFLHMNGINTLQNQRNYMTSKNN